MARTFQVTFDAQDPGRLAEFWQGALGYAAQSPPDGFDSWENWARAKEIPEERWNDAAAAVDPDGKGPRIFIQKVPESKTSKNRVHLDIDVTERGSTPEQRRAAIDAEVLRLVGLGATRGEDFDLAETQGVWTVMQDPEGNEFCIH
ncbi:MAG: VOC family protein [Actinomycetota bacterium]